MRECSQNEEIDGAVRDSLKEHKALKNLKRSPRKRSRAGGMCITLSRLHSGRWRLLRRSKMAPS